MQFRDVLNRYIEQIGCSAKELSDASRVSPAVISRYRSGERIPSPESPQLLALAEGIAELSRSNPLTMISRDDVYRTFLETISGVSVDYGNFLLNLNQLVKTLGISNTDLAQALLFDPSYISRILAGQRRPADMPQFLKVVSSFAAQRYRRNDAPDALAHLLDCDKHALLTEAQCAEAIESWLSTHINPRIDSIAGFMRELDSYDFYEFARSLRTGHIQPQKNSSYLPLSHVYVGPSEIAQSRIDFLKIARDSHANDTVILYSDLPMNKGNQDPEYQKNIIYHLGLLLDRGVEMKIVHDIHRPYDEMIMGLKSMIPAYMSGQIFPYYLPRAQNEVFQHFLWVSGTAALAGEAIAGHPEDARTVLTQESGAVEYYRKRANQLLAHARPLLDVYRSSDREDFRRLVEGLTEQGFAWRMVLSCPPVCTAPSELLDRILDRNGVSADEAKRIHSFAEAQRRAFLSILERGSLHLEVSEISEEEAKEYPVILPLSCMFASSDITLSYEDYQEHLEAARAFAHEHDNCTLVTDKQALFRNIQIAICDHRCVVISKHRAPALHFVVSQPDMVSTIDAFIAGKSQAEPDEPA